jgi:hypothetical protein
MARVYASIPKLVTKEKGERNKEIYFLAFATKLATEKPDIGTESLSMSADDPVLAHLFSNHANRSDALLEHVFVGASPTFQPILAGRAIPLSGDGVILYPPMETGDLFALTFFVVESDSRTRSLGKLVGGILEDTSVKTALNAVSTAAGGPAGMIINTLASVVPNILSSNGDDIYFSQQHSGISLSNYGNGIGVPMKDYEFENQFVSGTFRVQVF